MESTAGRIPSAQLDPVVAVAAGGRRRAPVEHAQTRPGEPISPYYGSFSLESRWVIPNPNLLLISKVLCSLICLVDISVEVEA